MNTNIPSLIFLMCKCGAYLVGSYAHYIIGKTETFNDFDLIVPPDKWHCVSLLIPKNARINKHGGWKFKIASTIVDIWPSTIEEYLRLSNNHFRKQLYVVDYLNERIFTSFILEEKI